MVKTDVAIVQFARGLPIRTTVEDIEAVCAYLARKPTGATLREAKAVLDAKHLDPRKLGAMKRWGLLEENGGRLKLLERGRRVAKDGGVHRASALLEVVRE